MPSSPIIQPAKEAASLANTLTPLNAIRTETVFSRLPIHNLAKKGKIDIQILQKNDQGEVVLHWLVSYNERHGQPRQLAYKLDTIIINRKIDELAKPLPPMICLGSLHAIAEELGLTRNTNAIKKAILQNVGSLITAKLRYTGSDGVERTVETTFTRYNVYFTGQRLPDGSRADAVYLILNEPYREVLNHAITRPLDYEYLKALTPAAQRFYEIMSYKIFAAIKYGHATAKISYLEYCTYSAQQHYEEYKQIKKQMYKVHRPHLESGYLKKVGYETAVTSDGKRDWLFHYTPGPKAHAEFTAFNGKRAKGDSLYQDSAITIGPAESSASDEARDLVAYFHKSFGHRDTAPPTPKDLELAATWISQFGMAQSRFIIDHSVEEAYSTKYNPKMLIGIQQYVDGSIQVYARQEKREARQREEARETRLKHRYELYQQQEIDRLKSTLSPQELADMENAIRADLIAEGTIPGMVSLGVRVKLNTTLADRAGVPSYEEWRAQHIAP